MCAASPLALSWWAMLPLQMHSGALPLCPHAPAHHSAASAEDASKTPQTRRVAPSSNIHNSSSCSCRWAGLVHFTYDYIEMRCVLGKQDASMFCCKFMLALAIHDQLLCMRLPVEATHMSAVHTWLVVIGLAHKAVAPDSLPHASSVTLFEVQHDAVPLHLSRSQLCETRDAELLGSSPCLQVASRSELQSSVQAGSCALTQAQTPQLAERYTDACSRRNLH